MAGAADIDAFIESEPAVCPAPPLPAETLAPASTAHTGTDIWRACGARTACEHVEEATPRESSRSASLMMRVPPVRRLETEIL